MNVWLLFAIFATPVFIGFTMGAVAHIHTRRVLAAGFRHGRALNIARLPQPVEPMPPLRKDVA